MIPRKRLQVLLYILQIFYVFGDGDPGGEGLSELTDNIIEDPVYTTELLPDHRVYERVTENDNASDSAQINDLRPDGNLGSQENISTADQLDLNFSKKTVIENVTVDNVESTSLDVSWTISGDTSNDTLYLIEVWEDEKWIQASNSTDLKCSIENLEPCTKYKIGVKSWTDIDEAKYVNATTALLRPGAPKSVEAVPTDSSSLQITWQIPSIGANCVKEYRITVDTGTSENRHHMNASTKDTSYLFENLRSCYSYLVSVTPIDKDNKDGQFNSTRSPPTFAGVPVAPVLYDSGGKPPITTESSITLVWNVTNKVNNCTLESVTTVCDFNRTEGYGFVFKNGSVTVNLAGIKNLHNVTTTVKDLSPFTHYECQARVKNEESPKEVSPFSSPVNVLTDEDKPSSPMNFQNIGRDSDSRLSLTWEAPRYCPGKLRNYRINFTWFPHYPVPDVCKLDRSFIADNIDSKLAQYTLLNEEADAHYFAKISARTGAGWSNEVAVEFDSTSEGVPDEVTNLRCMITPQKDDPNSLETELSWGLPCLSRGFIYYFDVSVFGQRKDFENHSITDVVNVTEDNDKNYVFRINFGELRPLYKYEFEVSATLHGGSLDPGKSSKLEIVYPAGIPPQPDAEYIKSIRLDPHKARKTTSSAAILLPLFPDLNGNILSYAIMVSGVSSGNYSTAARFNMKEEKWPNVSSWEEALEKDFDIPYQATTPMWNPFPTFVADYGQLKAVRFVVGEDTTCPEVSANTQHRVYCNGPLKPDTYYEVRMRAFTDMGYADSVPFKIKTNAELNVGLVLGVVFGILFLGILTTLLLMVKRTSFRLLVNRLLQSNIPESPVPDPFTRRKFLNHCQQLAENPGKLSNEFQLLQTLSIDLQMPSNTACLQANRKKNRYSDILPYDFSRVKLEVIDDDPNSDYINASYIKGYSGAEEYIACQGPKEDTTYDFWRMVDQYDVKMILMLTQLVERGKEKCHQYFPAIREAFNYEKFSIRCTSELDYRTYTQRTLVLQKDDTRRTITHLHFKDWPDHDVPDDFDAMIHFCQTFRKQFSAVKGLAVVHCSAGIGRTGTLIAVDILLQSIRDNRKLDVFGTVYRLRRHRLNMVQRESQYAYIYNCIRQVLKNPYFLKTYKPPPIDPIYSKDKTKKERSDSRSDSDSFDTLRKNSLSTSVDSMQPLCQSSPQATPKIQMNGLRYCKSTSAIDTRSNHNRIGRYNSEGYAICESAKDSFSTSSKDSMDENDLKSSSSSIYENVEPLIRPSSSSSQTIAGSSYYLTNDSVEKDTSL